MPEEGSIPITGLSLSLAQDAHRENTRILNQKAVTTQAVIAVFTLTDKENCLPRFEGGVIQRHSHGIVQAADVSNTSLSP